MVSFLGNGETLSGSLASPTVTDQIGVTLKPGLAYEFDFAVQTGLTNPGFVLLNSSGGIVARSTDQGNGQRRITYSSTINGALYLAVSGSTTGSYTITSAAADDYTETTATTGTLDTGVTASGTLQTVADTDDFGVTLKNGFAYQFDLQGLAGLNSLGFVLLNSSGGIVARSTDLGNGHRRITYTSTFDGGVYLAVSGSTTGSYTITSAAADDYTETTATTGTLDTGGTASGTLQTVADTDNFSVTLNNGFAYQFDLQGLAGLNSLGFVLLNSSGGIVARSTDQGNGHWRITYTSTFDGGVYLAVSGSTTGSYTITSAAADDYTETTATTGTLDTGGTASGAFQTVADTDDFSVTLQTGLAYQFDLQGLAGLNSLGFVLLNSSGGIVARSTDQGNGHWRITYTSTFNGGAYLAVSGSTTGSYKLTSVIPGAINDFNSDGKSDLLLQKDSGDLVIWTQANLAITQGIFIGNPGPTWHAVSIADFNGDRQPDVLLQNNNGAIVDYLMNGTTITAGNYLGNAGPSWHVRGAADFNQDGKADILLQNDNGGMVIWTTNGSSVTAGVALGNPGPGWTVEGLADFNGDGQPDILVQNSNGAIVDYLMNRTAIATGNNLGNPGPGWTVSGAGDYNGDKKADILLQNNNGADVLWETNGTSVIAAPLIGNPGPSYTGALAGLDLNGDGMSDLVIQNTDSTLVGYTLNSSGGVTAGANLGAPGIGWHAISNVPMEFIDGTGANPNLTGTIGADQFDLTSYTIGLHQIFGFNAATDSVALNRSTFPSFAAVQAAELPYNGGTYVQFTPGSALVIQGVTPDQLGSSNFVLRQ